MSSSCTFYDDPLKGEYCVETGDESKNILSIFAAPPGYVVVRADYCVPLDTLVEVEGDSCAIGDMQGEEVMVGTSTGYKRGYNIHTTGMKECLEIGTASGKILPCAEDHIVCVRPGSGYKWVRAMSFPGG